MVIRHDLTENDIKKNMLEIAMYLAEQMDDTNTIEVTAADGLYLRFEMWTNTAAE